MAAAEPRETASGGLGAVTRFRRLPRRFLAAAALAVLALLGSARWIPGWYWAWRTDNPVRRGGALAAGQGCLSCHMPRGTAETANPGSRWGSVPSFFRGNLAMYVASAAQVQNFIAWGNAQGSESKTLPSAGETTAPSPSPPFHMRAFRDRLGPGQIADLAAFVLAADGYLIPQEGPVAQGSDLSLKYGCESCHGVGGSGATPNPRSFTGTVPGWTGPDFSHLVSGRAEFGQWVLDGRSRKMSDSRAAAFFLNRANLQMPSFRGTLSDKDVDALWQYVQWLRETRGRPSHAAR